MPVAKIAITIDENLLKKIDLLVKEKVFPNRSKAVQDALLEKFERADRNRLASECAKLDPRFEQQLADEGLKLELDEWPEY